MDKFLSCDWGTSTFRLRLVDVDGFRVVAEERNNKGIANTYALWKQQQDNVIPRGDFYAAVIKEAMDRLAGSVDFSLDTIPIILSGMASSTMGLKDVPYKEMPLHLDGSDLSVEVLDMERGENRMVLVSGAKTADDVMRGEETKIVGCAPALEICEQERLLIFPGTHPKHVAIRNNWALTVNTFMTGEFFDLLSTKSVLSMSVEKNEDFNDSKNQLFFVEGVNAGKAGNLLQCAFKVRTNEILKSTPKQQNFYYLSGLLIGAELAALSQETPVYLVGSAVQTAWYRKACHELKIPVVGEIDADLALIKGQYSVLSKHCLR